MEDNRRIKVYLDTSVISYLDQQDSPEKMQETRDVWELIKAGLYEIYISDLVLRELDGCQPEKKETLLKRLSEIEYNLITVDDKTSRLAEKIIAEGILKEKCFVDCQHIAAAILSDCDVIVSWNLKHIVNVKTMRGIRVITMLEGYKDLMIYPPPALFKEEE